MSNPSRPTRHPELDAPFIERQRRKLEALRGELLDGGQRMTDEIREEGELHGNEASEFEDDAQTMAQREVDQAKRNVHDRRLAAVERALEKITDGTYGLSEESGQPISRARLESTPEAVYTIDEERRRESRG